MAHRYTFMFFSNMAKLLKADFEPVRTCSLLRGASLPSAAHTFVCCAVLCCVQFLERLVPVLMDCVRSNDGVAYNAEETDALGEMIDDFDDDDDDEYAAEGALGDANSDDFDDDDYNAPST